MMWDIFARSRFKRKTKGKGDKLSRYTMEPVHFLILALRLSLIPLHLINPLTGLFPRIIDTPRSSFSLRSRFPQSLPLLFLVESPPFGSPSGTIRVMYQDRDVGFPEFVDPFQGLICGMIFRGLRGLPLQSLQQKRYRM